MLGDCVFRMGAHDGVREVPGAGQQKSACSPGRALSTASQWSDQTSASMRTYALVAEHVRWQKHACCVQDFRMWVCTCVCARPGVEAMMLGDCEFSG